MRFFKRCQISLKICISMYAPICPSEIKFQQFWLTNGKEKIQMSQRLLKSAAPYFSSYQIGYKLSIAFKSKQMIKHLKYLRKFTHYFSNRNTFFKIIWRNDTFWFLCPKWNVAELAAFFHKLNNWKHTVINAHWVWLINTAVTGNCMIC